MITPSSSIIDGTGNSNDQNDCYRKRLPYSQKRANIINRHSSTKKCHSASRTFSSTPFLVTIITLLLLSPYHPVTIAATESSTCSSADNADGGGVHADDGNCIIADAKQYTEIVEIEELKLASSTEKKEEMKEENNREEEGPKLCHDNHPDCSFWAGLGECDNNPTYMHDHCQISCEICVDMEDQMGVPQQARGSLQEETLKIIDSSKEYFHNVVEKDPKYAKVRDECKNRDERCSFWAASEECTSNPSYMTIHCALSCQTCDQLDYNIRCPGDPSLKKALGPGDLNRLFEGLVASHSGVEVRSRPPSDSSSPHKPWIITFDDFLTPAECDRLIELGGIKGYERSTNVGKMKFDGTFESDVSTTRTSHNAWCIDECYDDPISLRVVHRIANVTGIDERNQEYMQMLRYEVGQFYRQHHDYIGEDVDRLSGPRVLTFFLYLNDVEEGGGTKFNDLGIVVQPKKGRALLWPSVIDADPMKKEYMTHHEALPVERGAKYGANAWIHMFDFKTPNEKGCT